MMAIAPRRVPAAAVIIGGVIGAAVVAGTLYYLARPAPKTSETAASAEARAYVSHLRLSDVTMKASENFMKQQVVEIEGKIANNGPRPLRSVDIYCIFHGIDGHELHRERVPIVRSNGSPLGANQSRPFRLPFDSLPDGWNQAVPQMYIAGINFAGE